MSIAGIDAERIPGHVSCVMDGTRRWAERHGGGEPGHGHRAGQRALLEVIDAALEFGVEWLTVCVLRADDWSRPSEEVRSLLSLNEVLLARHQHELNSKQVRIRFVGRRDWRIPRRLARQMDEATALTAGNRRLTLTLALNYSGQAEMVDAVKQIMAAGVDESNIDEALVIKHLYDPEMPDVDLWISTSGESRFSDFLIWQAAYAELLFTDTLWPDFGRDDLAGAISEYQGRNRRFGGLGT